MMIAAKAIVLATIKYLDEVQACPFCELGHVPEEVEMFSMHDEGCPLQGFERTEEVERLRAWACDGSADIAAKARSAEPATGTPGETAPASPSAPFTSAPVRPAGAAQRVACVPIPGLHQNCHFGTIGCITSHAEACHVPPVGWWCSRGTGHDGPCAARRATEKHSEGES